MIPRSVEYMEPKLKTFLGEIIRDKIVHKEVSSFLYGRGLLKINAVDIVY